MARDNEIAAMIYDLKQRQARFEGKNASEVSDFLERITGMTSISKTVSLFPGEVKTVALPNVKLGKIKFEVKAPNFADWECVISYMDFTGIRPRRLEQTLYQRKGADRHSVEVNRGKRPDFNVLSLEDWKKQFPEQLVLDTTSAKFTYIKFDDPSIDDLPQHASRFSIRVTSA